MGKLRVSVFFIALFLLLCAPYPAFCQSLGADYLCEIGISFYKLGRYDDALHEFNKVLLIDPDHGKTKKFVNMIYQAELSAQAAKDKKSEPVVEQAKSRDKKILKESEDKKEEGQSLLEISGEQILAVGLTSDDVIWKDANADKIGIPHEKNWRYLWGNLRHNTYDPKIYDRLTLGMESHFESPLNAFMEITVDPWTFIGKNQVTVSSTAGGDVVDMDLKYWSNDKRTINEIYRSKKGNIINLKQIKVDDGKTTITTPTGITDWGTTYNAIQPMEINSDYRPIRKLWLNYIGDGYLLKFFPISDQYEALTTDDPLRLSNNHVYWEEGPWLDEYEPSRIFEPDSGLLPIKKGRWIRRLSFFTKDSSFDYPHRLTFLRGASFKLNPGSYSFETTIATPMSLWDEYDGANSVNQASRFKVPVNDDLEIGFTSTSKVGLNAGSPEALNFVGALDLIYRLDTYNSFYAEAAGSHTDIEEAINDIESKYDGIGAKLGFLYDATEKKESGINRFEAYLVHMDSKFFPGLSNYRYTRNEGQPFAQHLTFAEVRDEDKGLIWGDGVDRGRQVIGLKMKVKSFNQRLDTDIKYRNVRRHSGKYLESVLRTESTFNLNPRLTSKLLAYYQHLPRTHKNYDPLIYAKTMYSLTDFFSEEDIFSENSDVIDDKDPSIGAFGLGAKYAVIEEQLFLEGIYERTNDPLSFPRGLLNDTYVTTVTEDGVVWDKVVPYLYDQNFFDLPPYDYYHIAKSKLIYLPCEELEFILSYTYNENKHSTGIDDNINHVGLEATYMPNEKLSFWLKFVWSRLIDVYKQNKEQRSDFYEGHHNVFFGTEYRLNPDTSLTLLYGEFVDYDDPYEQANWTLSALDTQHIFRLYYKRKF